MFFFFLTFLSCPFQNLRAWLIKNTVFSNCARFCTPERCAHVTCLREVVSGPEKQPQLCIFLFCFVFVFRPNSNVKWKIKHSSFFLKVRRRPILFIWQLSMIANTTWFESTQTCTTCKNWKHCHGLAHTTDSAMWSESHMFEMDCLFSSR